MIKAMKYLGVFLVLLVVAGSLIALNTIYPVLPVVANMTRNIGKSVADNWQGFLFSKKDEEAAPALESENSDELESRIKAEVDKAVAARLAEMQSSGGGSGQGLVVMSADQQGSTTAANIAQSFSDQVIVTPDASGQSGVITPIFRNGQGDPYLYILTPIKK